MRANKAAEFDFGLGIGEEAAGTKVTELPEPDLQGLPEEVVKELVKRLESPEGLDIVQAMVDFNIEQFSLEKFLKNPASFVHPTKGLTQEDFKLVDDRLVRCQTATGGSLEEE